MKARRTPAYMVARSTRPELTVKVPHQGYHQERGRCKWCNCLKQLNENGVCATCVPAWTRYRNHAARGDYPVEGE